MESGSKALRAPDIVKSLRVIVSPLALQTHKFDPVIAHPSKDAALVKTPDESLYNQSVMPKLIHDDPGIQHEPWVK
jgi:hypothetical protein